MSGKKIRTLLLFVAVSLFLFAGSHVIAAQKSTPEAIKFELVMEHLWINQSFHERHHTLAMKAGKTEESKALENELIENARAIGDSLMPYYGKINAYLFSNLVAANSGAIDDYRLAAFKGDKAAMKAAEDKMSNSAGNMAAFLSTAFPKGISKDTLRSKFLTIQKIQRAEIDAVVEGNFTAERGQWSELETAAYNLAETITNSIVSQFPEKF